MNEAQKAIGAEGTYCYAFSIGEICEMGCPLLWKERGIRFWKARDRPPHPATELDAVLPEMRTVGTDAAGFIAYAKAQGTKYDSGKTRIELVPARALCDMLAEESDPDAPTHAIDRAYEAVLRFNAGADTGELLRALGELVLNEADAPDDDPHMFSMIEAMGRVMTFGATKYGDYNWAKGLMFTRLIGAALRHLTAAARGVELDDETQELHIVHAACCISMLYETATARPDLDDRNKDLVIA